MRLIALCVTALTLVQPLDAYAAPASQADASAIEHNLTYYLSDSINRDGLIRILPAGDHYTLTINPGVFLTAIDRSMHPNEVQSLSLELRPGDDGLWHLAGHGALKVSADFAWSFGKKGHLVMAVEDAATEILFDPILRYPRNAIVTLKGVSFSGSVGKDTFSLKIAAAQLDTSLENIVSGTADLKASATVQTVAGESGPETNGLSIHSALTEWSIGDANMAGIRNLLTYMLDQQKKGVNRLSASDEKALREMVLAQLPLASGLSQETYINELNVTGTRTGSIGALMSSFAVAKGSDETKIKLAYAKPSLPPELLSAPLIPLLPERLSSEIAIKGLHWSEAVSYAFHHFKMNEHQSAEENFEFRKVLAPEQRLLYSFENTWAHSSLYDLAISGWLSTPVGPTGAAPELKMQVSAKGLDTLLKYLDDNTGRAPPFAQTANVLLMAKGLAKQVQDVLSWDIAFSAADQLTVNGQKIPR